MAFDKIEIPAEGDKITVNGDFSLNVPDQPIIPIIEGDGIGVDVSPVMQKVVDAAVEKPGNNRGKRQAHNSPDDKNGQLVHLKAPAFFNFDDSKWCHQAEN